MMEKHVVFAGRSAVAMGLLFAVSAVGFFVWSARVGPFGGVGITPGLFGAMLVLISLAFTATSGVGFAVAEVLKQQGECIGELERILSNANNADHTPAAPQQTVT
jgi:hypothetical protein